MAQERQSVPLLCDLQTHIAQGEHQSVRIEGVYLAGMEGGSYIVVPECSIRSTYVEFELKNHKNWNKLRKLIKSNREKGVIGDGTPVLVIFEGEFYGPPATNPTFPEAFKKAYHPGWDSNALTKLIVHSIRSVKPLPANHPCASSKSNKWPCFQRNAFGSISEPDNHSMGIGKRGR